MKDTQTDKIDLFELFIDRYCPSISSTIARLTGLADTKELETLSVNVLVDLWKKHNELFSEIRPAAFIYKILLQHVFAWLRQQGKEEHILLLQNTLLIDPAHYDHIPTSEKKFFNLPYLMHKVKKTLKEF